MIFRHFSNLKNLLNKKNVKQGLKIKEQNVENTQSNQVKMANVIGSRLQVVEGNIQEVYCTSTILIDDVETLEIRPEWAFHCIQHTRPLREGMSSNLTQSLSPLQFFI